MDRFIGREQEMKTLNDLWNQEGLVTCCIWGRRRIGKSRLLYEFGKDKRTLTLQGIKESYYENLSSLKMDVEKFLGEELGDVEDLSHLLKIVEDICKEEHTLLIIDELPYILESAPQASSVIQKMIDIGLRDTDCMVVICGSSISTMREETENPNRPLYGRFEHSIQIKQLPIDVCRQFHPDMDTMTSLRWYATVGGIPMYHKVDQKKGYQELVIQKFLDSVDSWRYDAPNTILQEFKGNSKYTGVVRCIADGYVRQKEIAEKMHIDTAECKRILDNLEFVKIVERLNPMGGAPKKPIYRIIDPFIAFHYQVLSKNMRTIEQSRSTELTYRYLENDIYSHLGHIYETICGQWLDRNYPVLERGSWWGRIDGEDVDIDIMAKTADDRGLIHNLCCECKFSVKPMGFTAYNTLVSRVSETSIKENISYVLFSSTGFEEKLSDYAEEHGIVLIDGETIMGDKQPPNLF